MQNGTNRDASRRSSFTIDLTTLGTIIAIVVGAAGLVGAIHAHIVSGTESVDALKQRVSDLEKEVSRLTTDLQETRTTLGSVEHQQNDLLTAHAALKTDLRFTKMIVIGHVPNVEPIARQELR